MKKLILLAGMIALLVACGNPSPTPITSPVSSSPSPTVSTSSSPTTPTTTPNSSPTSCQATDQDQYVYNPKRLQILEACLTVTGTIDFLRGEPDGDFHIGLKLDPQFANLVNNCNSTCLSGAEHGDLVVEPVCMLTVTQSDAQTVCRNDPNPIGSVPNIGDHVWMQGRYVLDTDHGWMELHPLYRWETN